MTDKGFRNFLWVLGGVGALAGALVAYLLERDPVLGAGNGAVLTIVTICLWVYWRR
ncbi:MAG TPA: hypothetical protein VNM40_02570 [Candidatus Paceibacterota bacterium]|nr:hypothetical protein [Candidatus Paceibacterota bacterium]